MLKQSSLKDFGLRDMPPQEGRIALVTGANHGIGFETTMGLAKAGLKVVMACRNLDKAEKAKTSILEKLPNAQLELLKLDLSDFDNVRQAANEVKSKYQHLDILINNAGILLYAAATNADDIELQLATNHLGHFLLTGLLLEKIPDQSESRIVSMSSVAHKRAQIYFEDLNCEQRRDALAAYGQSKLACLMFGDELDRRLESAGRSLTSLSVHPGGSDSGLFEEMPKAQYYTLKALAPLITHTNAAAARPSLFAALSPRAQGGDYYGPTGFQELSGKLGYARRSPYAKREDIGKRLWAISEEMTGFTYEF